MCVVFNCIVVCCNVSSSVVLCCCVIRCCVALYYAGLWAIYCSCYYLHLCSTSHPILYNPLSKPSSNRSFVFDTNITYNSCSRKGELSIMGGENWDMTLPPRPITKFPRIEPSTLVTTPCPKFFGVLCSHFILYSRLILNYRSWQFMIPSSLFFLSYSKKYCIIHCKAAHIWTYKHHIDRVVATLQLFPIKGLAYSMRGRGQNQDVQYLN